MTWLGVERGALCHLALEIVLEIISASKTKT